MSTNKQLIDKIQQAKEAIGDDAIPIIEQHLGITFKDGRASCPFHRDDTPSFIWNPKGKYARCFSCSRVYSILDYLIDIKGSFKEAVNELFKMAHMEYDLYNYKPFDDDRVDWFKDYVYPHPEHEPTEEHVIKYLGLRGISPETIAYAGVKEDKNGNIAFEHRDLDGKLLCTKYRVSHKIKHGDRKFWWQTNSSHVPILYNVMKLDYTKPLVITEAAIDALSVIEAGYTNVCAVPDGAGSLSWINFNYDFLENFEHIILYFDNDEAGEEGLHKVIPRLGEYRCKIVRTTKEDEDMVQTYYEQYHANGIRKTDANNVLLACGKQRLLDLINRAQEVPVKNLKYLMDCEITDLKDVEKVPTGLKALDDILYGSLMNTLTIYTGTPGCVDCDTEYFNGTEWKRIADYVDGDKVLQYNEDGTATLVDPIQYHKYPANYLWHFKTKYGLDQCLSEEHNVYYITSKNNLYYKTLKEIMEMHNKSQHGFTGRFITSYKYSGKGIDLTDSEIKLMCAVICDGSFYYDNDKFEKFRHRSSNNTCRFHIKKERKKEKLKELFDECSIEYREVQSTNVGYTDFYIIAPRHEKEFTSYWYNCSNHQLQVICDNILFWDEHKDGVRKGFSTTNKNTADFIQFAFASCGYRATILVKDRSGQEYFTRGKIYTRKSVEYHISITQRNLVGMTVGAGHEKTKFEKYNTLDGLKYCFTVPSHMWIMRRNGRIVITGNSGKSSLCNLVNVMAPIEAGHKVFIFSGELSEGQLLSWLMAPLAGLDNAIVWDNNGGRKGFSVTQEAEQAIRKYYHDNIILYTSEDSLEADEDDLFDAMETAYRKYGCDIFLIDNLMLIPTKTNGDESQWDAQKALMIKFMSFVNNPNRKISLSIVSHPKKINTNEEIGIYSLHGSSNISNLCHRMISVKRLQNDDEGYSMELEIIKDRPSQAAGKKCKLMYDFCTRRIYSTNEELTHHYNWEKSFSPNYSDNVKKNIISNRQDVMVTIHKIPEFNPESECDQF